VSILLVIGALVYYWFLLALCTAAGRADDAIEHWFHHHGRV